MSEMFDYSKYRSTRQKSQKDSFAKSRRAKDHTELINQVGKLRETLIQAIDQNQILRDRNIELEAIVVELQRELERKNCQQTHHEIRKMIYVEARSRSKSCIF